MWKQVGGRGRSCGWWWWWWGGLSSAGCLNRRGRRWEVVSGCRGREGRSFQLSQQENVFEHNQVMEPPLPRTHSNPPAHTANAALTGLLRAHKRPLRSSLFTRPPARQLHDSSANSAVRPLFTQKGFDMRNKPPLRNWRLGEALGTFTCRYLCGSSAGSLK